jgi:hypothetical protein
LVTAAAPAKHARTGFVTRIVRGSSERMASQEIQKDTTETKYLSKRVVVNGQFVTLYSINGQTWLSSPEEIPELMARLDNARIMLANPDKAPEGEAPKEAKKAPAAEPAPANPKLAPNKYRMKGPKPRPILRQGGVAIIGTPIDPISASTTVMKFGSETEEVKSSRKAADSNKDKPKIKAKPGMPNKNAASMKTQRGMEKKAGVVAVKAPKAPIATKSSPSKKAVMPVKSNAKGSAAKVVGAKTSKAKATKAAAKTKKAAHKNRKPSRK